MFDLVLDGISQLVGDASESIQLADWNTFAQLSPLWSPTDLQRIFYPNAPAEVLADLERMGYLHRRPKFLIAIGDAEYYQIYQTILQSPKLRFPDVQAILRAGRNLGRVLSQVVNHVVHWLNANPTRVGERDPNKPQLWQDLLPALDRESSTPLDEARRLQRQIFDIVYRRLDEFAEGISGSYLSKWPSAKDDSYLKRFECPVWRDLLVGVYGMVGARFQGLLAKFNTEDPGHLPCRPESTLVQAFAEAITRIPDVSRNPVLSRTESLEVLMAKIGPIVMAWATEQSEEAQSAKRLNQMSPGPLAAPVAAMAEHSKSSVESSKSNLGDDGEQDLDGLVSALQAGIEGPNADMSSNGVMQTSVAQNPGAMLPTRQLLPTVHEMRIQRRQHRQNHSGRSGVDQQQNYKEDLEVLHVEEPQQDLGSLNALQVLAEKSVEPFPILLKKKESGWRKKPAAHGKRA